LNGAGQAYEGRNKMAMLKSTVNLLKGSRKFDFNKFVEQTMSDARKEILVEGVLETSFYMIGKDKLMSFGVIEYENDSEKRDAYANLASLAAQSGAESVLVVSDVWVASKVKSGMRPSTDPDRTEAVAGVLISSDGSVARLQIIPYTRIDSSVVFRESLDFDSESTGDQELIPRWNTKSAAISNAA
jgi:hypothetical protein